MTLRNQQLVVCCRRQPIRPSNTAETSEDHKGESESLIEPLFLLRDVLMSALLTKSSLMFPRGEQASEQTHTQRLDQLAGERLYLKTC